MTDKATMTREQIIEQRQYRRNFLEIAATMPAIRLSPKAISDAKEFIVLCDMALAYLDAQPIAAPHAVSAVQRADIENECADLLLSELNRLGIDTEHWDGDEGLWPTLARSIAGAINAAPQPSTATSAAAPSHDHEGVGQGEVASAAPNREVGAEGRFHAR